MIIQTIIIPKTNISNPFTRCTSITRRLDLYLGLRDQDQELGLEVRYERDIDVQ